MKKGIITGLDHYGRGIVKINDKISFIENALPNEEVEFELLKQKSKFNEGKALNIIKSSTEREEPICPYYNECGGCNIMHQNYCGQLKFKENKVKEVLKKFANFDNVKNIVATEQYFYRNKITLQVNEKIGYFKNKTYNLIPIEKCYIVDNRINNIILLLNTISLDNIEQIVIRQTSQQSMLVFYVKKYINIDKDIFKDVDTIIINDGKEKIIKGKGYIVEEINDLKFIISPSSFFQVNTNGMIKLYDCVSKYCSLENMNLLDLYCGTGTIGLYLASKCNKVLGIEINEEAIKDAFVNKELNHILNIDFKSGDVKEILKHNNFIPNIVVVDPPRAGLDELVCEQLKNLNPIRIIYVSCDVVTLARDLKRLSDKYNIIECTPVDMFPNTYHVESVVILERK